MQKRLAALGPQQLRLPAGFSGSSPGASDNLLRGHTFHYSRVETPLPPTVHTVCHPSGSAGEAVYRAGSLTAS